PHKRLASTPLPANAGRDHSNAVNRSAASSQQRPVWLAMPQGSDKKPDGREAHRLQTHGRDPVDAPPVPSCAHAEQTPVQFPSQFRYAAFATNAPAFSARVFPAKAPEPPAFAHLLAIWTKPPAGHPVGKQISVPLAPVPEPAAAVRPAREHALPLRPVVPGLLPVAATAFRAHLPDVPARLHLAHPDRAVLAPGVPGVVPAIESDGLHHAVPALPAPDFALRAPARCAFLRVMRQRYELSVRYP